MLRELDERISSVQSLINRNFETAYVTYLPYLTAEDRLRNGGATAYETLVNETRESLVASSGLVLKGLGTTSDKVIGLELFFQRVMY